MRCAVVIAVLGVGCGRIGFDLQAGVDAPPNDATPNDAHVQVSIRIATANDDAEEFTDGQMYLDSGDLELCDDVTLSHLDQIIGLRFVGIQAPRGAKVTHAAVQFTVEGPLLGAPGMLTLRGELVPARPFTSTSGDLSVRLRTTASAAWVPPPWTVIDEAGPDQRTPELAPIIEEILARPEWIAGSAIAIFVTGTGTNQPYAFDLAPAQAPLLELEYEP